MTKMLATAAKIPRPRGRPSSGTRDSVPEEKILELAFREFAEHGFDGTTIRDLSRALGVSHNLLHVRFGSKVELWKRAIDQHLPMIARPVMNAFDQEGLSDEMRVRVLIARFCQWAADNPTLVSMVNLEGRRESWRLDYLNEHYIRPFQVNLEAVMERLAQQGWVMPISSAEFLALLVNGVGSYFASWPLMRRIEAEDRLTAEHERERVQHFTDFLTAALFPPAHRQSSRQ